MSIRSFKRKRDEYGSLIKHKAHLCAHGGMQKCGLNYLYTYSPVVNWVSVRSMIRLIILIELYTKSVNFVLSYTQYDVKTEIFMELSVCFLAEGDHPIEWVIRLY